MAKSNDVDRISVQFALSISGVSDLVNSWLNDTPESKDNEPTVAGLEPVESIKGGLGWVPKSSGQARDYDNSNSLRALRSLRGSVKGAKVAKDDKSARRSVKNVNVKDVKNANDKEDSDSEEELGRSSVGSKKYASTSLYHSYKIKSKG